MENKNTADKETFGLGGSSSSSSTGYPKPPRVHCPFCNGKFKVNDLKDHYFTCQAHTIEMDFQTTMGKLIFSLHNNLIKKTL